MTIETIDAELTRVRAELAELEATRRVLLRLGTSETPTPAAPTVAAIKQDCEGSTILECCQRILSENEDGMHFFDVADDAIRRGYSSNRDSSQDSIRRSFLDTLRRNDEEFTLIGKGHYKLTRTPSEELEEMVQEIQKHEQKTATV